MNERSNAQAATGGNIARAAFLAEGALAEGVYHVVSTGPLEQHRDRYVELRGKLRAREAEGTLARLLRSAFRPSTRSLQAAFNAIPTEEKWRDDIHNAVCTEGKDAALTHFLKGSTYTSTAFMGLIESTGYGFAGAQGSGVAATNLASSITAAGGAAPANGWNEATSSMCAARGTPSFGTASAGALALSAGLAFSILATATIKGCFVIVKSAGGTASTSTVGNINGALWSAGLFSGGDKPVGNGDTLTVSYSTSL